jgi:hypothetical protein
MDMFWTAIQIKKFPMRMHREMRKLYKAHANTAAASVKIRLYGKAVILLSKSVEFSIA